MSPIEPGSCFTNGPTAGWCFSAFHVYACVYIFMCLICNSAEMRFWFLAHGRLSSDTNLPLVGSIHRPK